MQRYLSLAAGLVVAIVALPMSAQRPERVPVAPSGASVVNPPARLADVRARVAALVDSGTVPSMAIGVAHEGRVIWREGLGVADPVRGVAASPDTVYTLASLGKAITATAAMTLVHRGTLDLDRPVRSYLRDNPVRVFEGEADALTPRALLRMRGGIPHLWRHYWKDDPARPEPLSALLRRHAVVTSPPGSHEHYSNLSYGLLQQLVEDVGRSPFDHYVRQAVFLPLGMNNSSLRGLPHTDHLAAAPVVGQSVAPYWYSEPEGGAGFRSSVSDLLRFGLFHLGEFEGAASSVLSPALLHAMHNDGESDGYQLGFGVAHDEGGALLYIANGGVVGATSMMLLLPRERLVIVALTNIASDTRHTDVVAHEIAARFVGGYRQVLQVPSRYTPVSYVPTEDLIGEWRGEIRVGSRAVPAAMQFGSDGDVSLAVDAQAFTPATALVYEQGALQGRVAAMLPGSGDLTRPHDLRFTLLRTGRRLYGSVLAQSREARPSFGLPFYIALHKQEAPERVP